MELDKKRKGLGRGLSELLGDDGPGRSRGTDGLDQVPVTDLEPNPDQPRKSFAEGEIEALSNSLREKGMLQPILVRTNPREATRYEIVAGERRWRAAQRAQMHEVPIIVQTLTDAEALEVALVENVQRVDLNPVEEAESYARLIEAFGYTQEQLAATVSKSRSHIANMMRLLKLPGSVKELLRNGDLTTGHARALIGQDGAKALAREIVERGLSVRDVEKRIAAGKAGEGAAVKAIRKGVAEKDTDTLALEGDLSAALGVPVELKHSQTGGGTLTIRYKSLDELDALCERFGDA